MAAIVAPNATEQAAKEFAAEASQIGCVVAVAAEPAPAGLMVWTLLDGDHDRHARYTLYDLELAVTDRHPDAQLTFRVLDAADHPGVPRRNLLPPAAPRLYERPGEDLQAPSSKPRS